MYALTFVPNKHITGIALLLAKSSEPNGLEAHHAMRIAAWHLFKLLPVIQNRTNGQPARVSKQIPCYQKPVGHLLSQASKPAIFCCLNNPNN
jgi:hypothetical protein